MPLIKYSDCTKKELSAFAKRRDIKVIPSYAFRRRHLRKRDYIKALKRSDKAATFDFMKLAPELRNRIYRELLLFHESYSCQPQILATCKAINSEASAILYRDNLIEVKLRRGHNDWYHSSSVQAHGEHCGRLTMFGYANSMTNYQWPEFLRRAQWIRVSTHYETAPGVTKNVLRRTTAGSKMQEVNYVLYSLCSFLQDEHRLVAIEVDVGTRVANILAAPVAATDEDAAHRVLSPLQLLGPLSLFHIINVDGSVAQLTQSSFPAHDQLQGGVLGPLNHALQEFRICERLWPFYEHYILHHPVLTSPIARDFHTFMQQVALAKRELNVKTLLCTSKFELSIGVNSNSLKHQLGNLDIDVLEQGLHLDVWGDQLANAKKVLDELREYRNSRKELKEAGNRSAA
ncbi:hypothetical protein LTR91_016879 [Friedmanniomyces endolithicus]|uniref:F-box domain-containing protein n=1 Tax=Friedmanniomyces endolithicus TaxID=329885 RepID=A0AAN6QKA4_9PEZI|nr:hypothetical protein LTR94_012870 [Friedmanniomyces endolithicus]KAK0782167.1 hypothetical protein LTR59_012269 [Friedmanniomyces endolithicus]KAK0818561.1 hypothetical protein LTR38_001143 [Friedmanniomyces endolithicus]KAK0821095.1 hypothetical protein LTR75_001165 [Friedmanniomyces endolithicus]KAK0841414.1 hypothetical protein LTR03_009947 [Friedmanniomyces endolithicus]